jgi:hypothetical protein
VRRFEIAQVFGSVLSNNFDLSFAHHQNESLGDSLEGDKEASGEKFEKKKGWKDSKGRIRRGTEDKTTLSNLPKKKIFGISITR